MYLLRTNEETHPVYWVDDFLSNEEIDKIIKYTEKINSEPAKVGISIDEKKKNPFTADYNIKNENLGNVPRLRQSIIKWIQLNADTKWIYKKIISEIHKVNQENFGFILKFVEDLQFTEYNENQKGFHANHSDCGDKTKMENFVDIRKLSFSIQLSDPNNYEGGELILYKNNKEFIAPKKRGTIIFFESDLSHKVSEIKRGTRYSLVSWVRGPNLR